MPSPADGPLAAALTEAAVTAFRDYAGRGLTKARTFLSENCAPDDEVAAAGSARAQLSFRSSGVLAFLAAVAVVAVVAPTASATTSWSQGYETDTDGWTSANRVPSGTHGVPSSAGAFHAEDEGGSAFTRWGGCRPSTFPSGGYTTSVDIYLDPSAVPADDTRFDWTSAISGSDGTFRRARHV